LEQPLVRVQGQKPLLQALRHGVIHVDRLKRQCLAKHGGKPLAEGCAQQLRRDGAQTCVAQDFVRGRCVRRQGFEQGAIQVEDNCSNVIVCVHL
jgi:hypothetical protein